jgi:EmrB/QacA subfamily drug resistance transporter
LRGENVWGFVTELSAARRQLVLVICCMSLFIVGIDVTIVNVALPSIQRDFHASVSDLQWTIDAYTLVLASLLMLSGSTADRLGRRRTFQVGLVMFTLGSLLCSVAPGLGWLVGFRMVQAIGGSMLNPVAMSIIVNTFTDPRERARAIGVWGGAVGISLALGPVVGGILVQTIGWRSIFWINVPIGIAAIVLTQLFIQESKAPHARRIDPPGQVLIIVLLASVTYAIIEGPRRGWTSAEIVGLFVLCAVAIAGLIAVELRRREPLIDVRFFGSAPFSAAAGTAIVAFAGLAGYLFLNTLYLQDIRGYSALHSGLLTLPFAAMCAVFAPISGRIVGSTGPRVPLVISGATLTIGAAFLAQLGQHTSIAYLMVGYVIFGIGFGLVNAPITNAAVSGMPREQAGVAAAIASTSRQIGSSLGVAITGSLVSASAGASSFIHDSHTAWWVITGCGAAVLVLGLLATSKWALATSERVRERLENTPDTFAEPPALVD